MQTNPLWDNNEIQFARLLCELGALGVPDADDWGDLLSNMDLEESDLHDLFERAHQVWERSKQDHCPPGR
jgi:hypothetical protein